jgi:hypothetical protein
VVGVPVGAIVGAMVGVVVGVTVGSGVGELTGSSLGASVGLVGLSLTASLSEEPLPQPPRLKARTIKYNTAFFFMRHLIGVMSEKEMTELLARKRNVGIEALIKCRGLGAQAAKTG